MTERPDLRMAALNAKRALEALLDAFQWPPTERAISLALDRIVEILSETT